MQIWGCYRDKCVTISYCGDDMPDKYAINSYLQAVSRMRINRTFSIPIELVQELKKKHNQSETVTRALRKYLDPNTDSSPIGEATTHQLMAVLTNRIDVDEGLKALLLQVLSKRF